MLSHSVSGAAPYQSYTGRVPDERETTDAYDDKNNIGRSGPENNK